MTDDEIKELYYGLLPEIAGHSSIFVPFARLIEARVIERCATACESLDLESYEVDLCVAAIRALKGGR